MKERRARSLTVTEELMRAYSRRANFHTDPETSAALGLPGLVAQGMQAAGPAYAELLDAWGDEFLEHGEFDLRFVGIVYAGDTVAADVVVDGDAATIDVTNTTAGHTAVVGSARRRSG